MKGSEKKAAAAEKQYKYEVKVTRAHEINDTTVAFDMIVNGVFINGCFYREGKSSKGEDYTMISFPSYKGKDKEGSDKYYNHCYFKIEDDVKEDITQQLLAMVK